MRVGDFPDVGGATYQDDLRVALFVVLIIMLWVLVPTLVGQHIGAEKNRQGWAWGLFLGWFGVLIVAVLSPGRPPLGVSIQSEGFATFRPKIVTGAMEAGYTYGYRRSDDVLLRQAAGSDQWVEVKDTQERAEVLTSMGTEVYLPRECPHCKQQIRVDISVCPYCQGESEPWRWEENRWWALQDGEWGYWDNAEKRWSKRPTPPEAKHPQPPPRRRRRLYVALAIAAVVAGAGVAIVWSNDGSNPKQDITGLNGRQDSTRLTGRKFKDAKGNTCDEALAHYGTHWPGSRLNEEKIWCPASVPK